MVLNTWLLEEWLGSNSEIEPLLSAIGPVIRESGVDLHFLGASF